MREDEDRHVVVGVRSKNSSSTLTARWNMDSIPEPLPSAGSAITGIHNLRPKQKLHNHTEQAKHDDRFPSARTHPQEHGLLLSFHVPQHVVREYDKAHQRRDLVTIPAMFMAGL